MGKRVWVTAFIFLVALSLVAFPLRGEQTIEFPLQANLTNIGAMLESVAFHEAPKLQINNAASALVRVTITGIYEIKVRGELEEEFVDEKREELVKHLTDFQIGVSSPDQFVNRMASVYESLEERADEPIITVTEETALGAAIKEAPQLLDTPLEELTKEDLALLIEGLSDAYERRQEEGLIQEFEPKTPEIRGEDETDGGPGLDYIGYCLIDPEACALLI